MAGSSRKGKKKAMSYAEVDSDVDMQFNERQVQARKAAATQKTPQRQKGRGKKKRAPLEAFLEMPFDILAEVCSHLQPIDLVNLSRANKVFHGLLLSTASRPLWSRFRSAVKAPAVGYLSDAAYARLVFTNKCSGCDKDQPTKLLWGVLARLCLNCRKKLLIAQRNVRSALPHLHPETTKVAFFTHNQPTSGRYVNSKGPAYHLRSELEDLSHKLYELQDEDELRKFVRPVKRSRGTRSRPVNLEGEEELTSVARYIQEREMLIQKPHEDVKDVKAAIVKFEEHQRIEWAARWQAWGKKTEARTERFVSLKSSLTELGWTEEEVRRLEIPFVYYKRSGIPDGSPEEDPQAWSKLHTKVAERLAKSVSYPSYDLRKGDIKPFYKALRKDEDDQTKLLTFPSLPSFLNLPRVKSMWAKGEKMTRQKWGEHLSGIMEDVEEYRDRIRGDTIRLILSTTNDVPLKTLSRRVESSNAGRSFFHLATSQLYYEKNSQSYPEAVAPLESDDEDADRWSYYSATTTARHVLIVRAMLEAAGLDEETATVEDLNKIGARFRWLEYRGKGTSRRAWEWLPLLHTILKHMPTRQRPYVSPTIVVDEMENEEQYSDED